MTHGDSSGHHPCIPALLCALCRAAAYPFFYIEPAKYPHLVAKFNDKQAPLADMPPVGELVDY